MKFTPHLFLGMSLACLFLSACQPADSPISATQAPNFVEAPAPVPITDVTALIALARNTLVDPHIYWDSTLSGEALAAHLAWAASLPPDSVLAVGCPDSTAYPPMPGDTIYEPDPGSALGVRFVINKPHCRYLVVGLQGIDCVEYGNPAGGLLCVQCDKTFPQGTCPSWEGRQVNHYDANGNVTCTGKVFMDLGIACDVCPMPAKIAAKG